MDVKIKLKKYTTIHTRPGEWERAWEPAKKAAIRFYCLTNGIKHEDAQTFFDYVLRGCNEYWKEMEYRFSVTNPEFDADNTKFQAAAFDKNFWGDCFEAEIVNAHPQEIAALWSHDPQLIVKWKLKNENRVNVPS